MPTKLSVTDTGFFSIRVRTSKVSEGEWRTQVQQRLKKQTRIFAFAQQQLLSRQPLINGVHEVCVGFVESGSGVVDIVESVRQPE